MEEDGHRLFQASILNIVHKTEVNHNKHQPVNGPRSLIRVPSVVHLGIALTYMRIQVLAVVKMSALKIEAICSSESLVSIIARGVTIFRTPSTWVYVFVQLLVNCACYIYLVIF